MADIGPSIITGERAREMEVCLAWAKDILEAYSETQALILFEGRINEMKLENQYDLAEALCEIIESSRHSGVRLRARQELEGLSLAEREISIYRESIGKALEGERHEADIEAALIFLSILHCHDEEEAFELLERNLEDGPLSDRSSEIVANILIQIMNTSVYPSVQNLAKKSLHKMEIKRGKIDQLILNNEIREAGNEEGELRGIIEKSMESGYLSGNSPEVIQYLLEIAKNCPHTSIVELSVIRLAEIGSGEMIGSDLSAEYRDAEGRAGSNEDDVVGAPKPWLSIVPKMRD